MKLLQFVLLSAGVALVAGSADASEALIKKARCVACHNVDKKIVGPAFRDVAAKYRDTPEVLPRLMTKVRNGGSGVWGEAAMPPNPEDRISDADLKSALEWVLSLK
jgi:cytochrome c